MKANACGVGSLHSVVAVFYRERAKSRSGQAENKGVQSLETSSLAATPRAVGFRLVSSRNSASLLFGRRFNIA